MFDQELNDEQLLTFSEIKNIDMFLPPFYAALCAKNGLEALKRFSAYKKLVGPIKVKVTEQEQTVSVQFSYVNANMKLPRFALLNEQVLIISLLRTGIGENIIPSYIGSSYEYGEIVEKYVQRKAVYDKDNRIEFKKEDLQKPFLTQNNIMWEYLEPQLKQKLSELSQETFTNLVRKTLLSDIPSGTFSLEEVARSLGISGRTLQRSLRSENTSFNEQIKYVQRLLAQNYMKDDTLTNTDIAYLVGYADPSSFARAFKNWTGETVAGYRRKVACELLGMEN